MFSLVCCFAYEFSVITVAKLRRIKKSNYKWLTLLAALEEEIFKIIMLTNTLTGHFIRCTLLVPGWTPFAFRTALNLHGIDSTSCWKHSSEILVRIDMIASRSCYIFFGCTSTMPISRSTTFRRCSIALRSSDCGGHWSTVNLLSCSRNQFEMMWALWHSTSSCWK